jgi:hypothetical protein
VSASILRQSHAMELALLSGSTGQGVDRVCVSGCSARQRQMHTSPDDIDRCDRTPQCLFDRASKDLEFIVARENKSRHDHD